MKQFTNDKRYFNDAERGAILVLVAITFTLFIGFVAIAIDINHLYVVRSELQNAADAGALAGASALYTEVPGYEAGERVNRNANAIAKETAEQNLSDKSAVEIFWTGGNSGDVQRGHWSFANQRFTPLETEIPAELWGVPSDIVDTLNGEVEYPAGVWKEHVNAVRVVARRHDIEAESFFAKIYGFFGFKMYAEAIAYVGFAGSLGPLEADVPIVICERSLSNGDCNIGRMISSDTTETSGNTAAWAEMTPYEEGDGECTSGTNSSTVDPLVTRACDCLETKLSDPDAVCGVNDDDLSGAWLAAIGGQVSSVMNPMRACYIDLTEGKIPWEMTLPVVGCEGNNVENCVEITSAVTVNMVLMTGPGAKPDDAPTEMTKPGAENFNDWVASSDCEFFYQLAGVDSGNPILDADGNQIAFYNSAIDPSGSDSSSEVLSDNYQSTVLKYLPDTDFGVDEDGDIYLIDDPWVIAGDSVNKIPARWDGLDSTKKDYTMDMARFDCFVNNFNLKNANDTYAPLADTSMYFLPDCEFHEPKGRTSYENYGIFSVVPVLVD